MSEKERLPEYLKNEILKIRSGRDISGTSKIIRDKKLNTVCTSSRCPNIHLCFSNKTATFLLLGDKCTRQCPFCNIDYAGPVLPAGRVPWRDAAEDESEPERISRAVMDLNLKHAVITMVTRDDLKDGGAAILIKTVKAIKEGTSCRAVEVLTSDFAGNEDAAVKVALSGISVFGHNMETVERLYSEMRPSSSYAGSLKLLKAVSKKASGVVIKSGIMVGLGETDDEVFKTIDDMIENGVEFITIGQYLRPSLRNVPVDRYVRLEKFIEYKKYAKGKGAKSVFSAPLVRSSFGAEKFFNRL